MFIYNVTTKVNKEIAEAWMRWQLEEHSTEIMATNLFEKFHVFKLHNDEEDVDGITFIFQYYASQKTNYDLYIKNHAPFLRKKAIEKWGDAFISFRSLLERVQ